MDVVISSHISDILYSLDPYEILHTTIIILLVQFFGKPIFKGKRDKILLQQREIFYQKLTSESLKMENEKLDEETKIVQNIKTLEEQTQAYLSSTDSEWSDDEKVHRELAKYQDREEQLGEVSRDIVELAQDLGERIIEKSDDEEKVHDTTKELLEKIRQLKLQNEELKAQVSDYENKTLLTQKETDLDPSILEFMEKHQDVLTLDFLEKAYQTLVELKASDQVIDFNEYMGEIKRVHSDYAAKIAELTVAKKEVELKLDKIRRQYDEELTSFNETRVEQIFKNSGASELLSALKEKNSVQEETIKDLKSKLEANRKEIALWQDKYKDAESQCSVYFRTMRDSQMKLIQLEAERKVVHHHGGMVSLNSESSFVDHRIPPAPPIDLPSADELLRTPLANNSYSLGAPNIPPPPPPLIELPIGGNLTANRRG